MGGRITFEAFERAHFARFVDWVTRPHVARWWAEPSTVGAVEAEYGPSVDGTDPTRCFLIVEDGRPVGFIQAYRVAATPDYAAATGEPDAVGMDLFIGDEARTGAGLGPDVIRAFVDEVVWPAYPDLARCIASPSVANVRSLRAFEKAGFIRGPVVRVPGETEDEVVMLTRRG
jgi:aminoglycoside 6'-N-acetyltransferase